MGAMKNPQVKSWQWL